MPTSTPPELEAPSPAQPRVAPRREAFTRPESHRGTAPSDPSGSSPLRVTASNVSLGASLGNALCARIVLNRDDCPAMAVAPELARDLAWASASASAHLPTTCPHGREAASLDGSSRDPFRVEEGRDGASDLTPPT